MYLYFNDKPWMHPAKPDHPERPHRLSAAYCGLAQLPKTSVQWHPLEVISEDRLHALAFRAHGVDYMKLLENTDRSSATQLDGGDTVFSSTTLPAALMALAGAERAVNDILSGQTNTGFLLARPPGHHARPEEAMGFCIFGTAAAAALYARDTHHARVAVLDFDLHHGNGTQDILWSEPDIFFASTHEEGNWPGTGHLNEVGDFDNIRNIPLPRGSGTDVMREAWSSILEDVTEFAPDLIIMSAGFDAHGDDPLSGLNWALEDYRWLGAAIAELSDRICNGKVLSILEGGYDLQVIHHCLPAYATQISELDDLNAGNKEAPSPFLGNWMAPYIGGYTTMPSIGQERFAVRKVNGRMWIEETATGQFLYTPPSFLLPLHSRDALRAVVSGANALGNLHIDRIITLEAQSDRGSGYNPGRSDDFACFAP